jgi:hypothetical protein
MSQQRYTVARPTRGRQNGGYDREQPRRRGPKRVGREERTRAFVGAALGGVKPIPSSSFPSTRGWI